MHAAVVRIRVAHKTLLIPTPSVSDVHARAHGADASNQLIYNRFDGGPNVTVDDADDGRCSDDAGNQARWRELRCAKRDATAERGADEDDRRCGLGPLMLLRGGRVLLRVLRGRCGVRRARLYA
jgi:hypothetical protein